MTQRRYVVYYSGQVQGVGFRYTVCRLSDKYEVQGFVRNLADGRVQVIAEGDTGELDRFFQAIREHMAGYIRHENLDRQEPSGEFHQFELRW